MLPYIDGIEVLKKMREKSTVPIIILSAKDQEIDRIIGLNMVQELNLNLEDI